MDQYFKAYSAHVHGEVSADARTIQTEKLKGPFIISLGTDDIVTMRNIQTQQQKNLELPPDNGFNCITLSSKTGRFAVGGISKTVVEMDIDQPQSETGNTIYEALGTIYDIRYSHSGRYLSIASEEQKCIVVENLSKKKYKCRPGHSSKIINTFFSPDDKYVATIGEDMFCLIYELNEDKDPQEVFRQKIPTLQSLPSNISGCFHFDQSGKRAFIPGTSELMEVFFLNSHWEMKKSKIVHSSPILCCESVSQKLLVTSCNRDLCIWGLDTVERLVVLEDLPMTKVIAFNGSFMGVKNDGKVYLYNRPLPSSTNYQMDIEQNQDKIVFDEVDRQYDEPIDLNDQAESQQEMRIKYISSKKTKADKIIEVLPQMSIPRSTSYFDSKRFLCVNSKGCIYQNRETQEDVLIQAEFHNHLNTDNIQTKTIFRNRDFAMFSMNEEAILYASSTQFGYYVDQFSSWEKNWNDITCVALATNWLAVANQSQIKIMDIAGNQIKSICFNRHILTMSCYENLLAVVYQQSVPMWNRQMIAMEIFSVNQISTLPITQSHVPITENCDIKWFDFSKEGMLFSQDSYGFIRSYSLETNEWTSLEPNFNELKRMWIIGIQDYKVLFWRTTEEEPEPNVRPRLPLKQANLAIAVLELPHPQLTTYPVLLWQRYCLQHQLARWRLWGHHKKTRGTRNKNYALSQTIMNEKQIANKHTLLDNSFSAQVITILNSDIHNNAQKALNLAKAQVRSVDAIKFLIDEFDSVSRNLAIEMEEFHDQKIRQMQYEAMLELELNSLRMQAQSHIQPKKNNPMNPKNKRIMKDPIPFNFSQSSVSNSIIMQDVTFKDPENKKQEEIEIENPCLKKKSTNENNIRRKQIEEQVEKFGIKKKVDRKNKL